MKTNILYQHLLKDENFAKGNYLFNMSPENTADPVPFGGRLWPIDIFNRILPSQKVGVMIWDDIKEKLHGPFVAGLELGSYRFVKSGSDLEIYLYFKGQVDYCISGFDRDKVVFEEC